MKDPWADEVPLIGPRGVAGALDIAPAQGDRVVRSGLAGLVFTTPSGPLVTRSAVEALASRPLRGRTELPPAVVLRANAPAYDGERWTGWSAWMDTEAVNETTLRWWPIAGHEALVGKLVVVAISGIPGWVGRIETAKREYGRVAIQADKAPESDSEARVYRSSRLNLPRGPLIDRIGL